MALLDFLNRKHKKDELEIVPVLPRDIYRQSSLDLVDTIAPTALKIGSRDLELGEKFVRTFYTVSYPRFLSDSWFSPIINLDKVLDVSLFIHPIDTEQALRNFQKKVAEVQNETYLLVRRSTLVFIHHASIRILRTFANALATDEGETRGAGVVIYRRRTSAPNPTTVAVFVGEPIPVAAIRI